VLFVGDHVAGLIDIESAFDAGFPPAINDTAGVRIGELALDDTSQLGGTLGSGGFADAVAGGVLKLAVERGCRRSRRTAISGSEHKGGRR